MKESTHGAPVLSTRVSRHERALVLALAAAERRTASALIRELVIGAARARLAKLGQQDAPEGDEKDEGPGGGRGA
jgi:hypothetical protein